MEGGDSLSGLWGILRMPPTGPLPVFLLWEKGAWVERPA